MKAWKFIVPDNRFYTLESDPSVSFKGCSAVVVAETETDARRRLQEYAAENGLEIRWLEVARVTELSIVPNAVLSFIMF